MKNVALLLFVLTWHFSQLIAQPTGIDDSIMNIKGKWKKREAFINAYDSRLSPKQFSSIYKKLDSIAAFFKQAYPDPEGIEAAWYPSIIHHPWIENGPSPYSFWSLYLSYYYNKSYKKILPEDETGTWAYVFINDFNWFLTDSKLDMKSNDQITTIWMLPRLLDQTWKGFPVFEAYTHSPNAKAVVITKDASLPWKPVTQLQYLQALRKKKEDEYIKSVTALDEGVKQGQKTVNDLRNKGDINESMKQTMVAAAQKQVDYAVQSREKNITSYKSVLDKDLKVIDDYIAAHSAESLQQQAIINRFKDFTYQKRFENPEEKNAAPLIYINPEYFDRTMPSHEPQFMVLYWRWNNNAPALRFKKEFENNFPVEKLKAMIAGYNKLTFNSPLKITTDIEVMVQSLAGPNNSNTWLAIKSKISDYLTIKWRSGELKGVSISDAFFVKADQTTMTQSDINNGKLIVEVGMALVKPGEFEVFRFQKQF